MSHKVNCLNLAYLFKASIGSINGSWTEGNVSTIKKITLPNGNQLPYISGQSLKYQVRKYWKEAGINLSEPSVAQKDKGVNYTLGNPTEFIDDDLLGFMIAEKKNNRRRTAPVRISPAIGSFPFRGDLDLGTKSKELQGEDMGAGGNIFETEISYNFYRVNALIELDRIGRFIKQELSKEEKEDLDLGIDIRKQRINNLLDAIQHIWGGGKQGRLLTDMSPKFVVFTLQSVKNPILLESLRVDENEYLDVDTLLQVLQDHSAILDPANIVIGMRSGIFGNESTIIAKAKEMEYDILSIGEAFQQVKEIINEAEF